MWGQKQQKIKKRGLELTFNLQGSVKQKTEQNSQNQGRKQRNTEFHRKYDFFMPKFVKYRKYSKNSIETIKQKPIKQTVHVPKIWIKPVQCLQVLACHIFCTCHRRSQNLKFKTPKNTVDLAFQKMGNWGLQTHGTIKKAELALDSESEIINLQTSGSQFGFEVQGIKLCVRNNWTFNLILPPGATVEK